MEGTTFIDESDVALYLEVSDGLTVLTLNCSLQYFYTTAIHDTKPLVLSFPLSVGFTSVSRSVWLSISSRHGESASRGFWLMGAWQVAVGEYFFFFFFLGSSLLSKASPSQK